MEILVELKGWKEVSKAKSVFSGPKLNEKKDSILLHVNLWPWFHRPHSSLPVYFSPYNYICWGAVDKDHDTTPSFCNFELVNLRTRFCKIFSAKVLKILIYVLLLLFTCTRFFFFLQENFKKSIKHFFMILPKTKTKKNKKKQIRGEQQIFLPVYQFSSSCIKGRCNRVCVQEKKWTGILESLCPREPKF